MSVVLCVRNGAATLGRQLAALAAQTFDGTWEIVLVDNASSDASRPVASAWTDRGPRLTIVEEPRVGLNRARNRGVRAACAPHIVFCDADDEVSSDWLREMAEALGTFDVVGGALGPDPLVRPRLPWEDCPQRSELPTVFERPYAVGANLGFRREVFNALDGFDEAFGYGAGEIVELAGTTGSARGVQA